MQYALWFKSHKPFINDLEAHNNDCNTTNSEACSQVNAANEAEALHTTVMPYKPAVCCSKGSRTSNTRRLERKSEQLKNH